MISNGFFYWKISFACHRFYIFNKILKIKFNRGCFIEVERREGKSNILWAYNINGIGEQDNISFQKINFDFF